MDWLRKLHCIEDVDSSNPPVGSGNFNPEKYLRKALSLFEIWLQVEASYVTLATTVVSSKFEYFKSA